MVRRIRSVDNLIDKIPGFDSNLNFFKALAIASHLYPFHKIYPRCGTNTYLSAAGGGMRLEGYVIDETRGPAGAAVSATADAIEKPNV